MARCYALLAHEAAGAERVPLTSRSRTMQKRAAEAFGPESPRVSWLNRWLERQIGGAVSARPPISPIAQSVRSCIIRKGHNSR